MRTVVGFGLFVASVTGSTGCSRRAPSSSSSAESPESAVAALSDEACPTGMVAVRGASFATPGNDGFCMDRVEVQIGEFNRCGPCVAATGPMPGTASRPVRSISPADMARYCAEQGKRLPTENEWELAARAAPIPTVPTQGSNGHTDFRCAKTLPSR